MFEKLLDFIISTGNVFGVLFTFSYIYTIITNTRRESERRKELKEFREGIQTNLEILLRNSNLQIETWRVMIERELERREKNE